MNCAHPTDQKLFAGYRRGVRVTASWGSTWITPGNDLRVYFNFRVVVWSTEEGLELTGEGSKAFRTTTPMPVPGYSVNCRITMGY